MWPISGSPAVRRIAAAGVSLVWLCASVIFFLLLTSIAQVGQVPTPVMGLLVLFAILSAWRPELALPMLAVIVPIATWLGHVCGTAAWRGQKCSSWPSARDTRLAGYSLPHRQPTDALSIPVWTATVVVLASLSVKLLFVLDTAGGAAFQAQLWTVLTRDYFIGHGGSPEIDAAMRLMEGLMLLSAASAIAAQPGRGPVLIQSIVLGAAAAGAVNLWYLWESALRQDSPFTTFLRYLRTIRFNRHYADVNAAGSYFVMALFPALAHVFRSWKVASVLASVLIGASLTFSGSRAAMVAAILGALLLAVRGFRRHDFSPAVSRLRLLTAIAVIALCGSVALVSLVRRNVSSSRETLKLRVQLTETSLHMIAAAPLFGIGIGEYFGPMEGVQLAGAERALSRGERERTQQLSPAPGGARARRIRRVHLGPDRRGGRVRSTACSTSARRSPLGLGDGSARVHRHLARGPSAPPRCARLQLLDSSGNRGGLADHGLRTAAPFVWAADRRRRRGTGLRRLGACSRTERRRSRGPRAPGHWPLGMAPRRGWGQIIESLAPKALCSCPRRHALLRFPFGLLSRRKSWS